jgi:hypothetical protein
MCEITDLWCGLLGRGATLAVGRSRGRPPSAEGRWRGGPLAAGRFAEGWGSRVHGCTGSPVHRFTGAQVPSALPTFADLPWWPELRELS